ncbi:cytochrome P450 4V2-like isoform X2 [Saccostrea echinata]|uniref:cytochrome P450 4V2-like isoform X2 n=1 Tax=Saccostrea echinata TaxID=191078 RepID=UPI002A8362A7|nr:cytochrome P450 4V2-like isoform X2 [Saccostrea echinata]XP_061196172.1 cytochrome P450 4V2-like isoform X2 [Saccostrea echinata]
MAAAIILAVAIILFTAWVIKRELSRKKIDIIPGPVALPILGNAHQLKHTSREFFDQLTQFTADYANYGIFRLLLGTKLTVALYKPEYVEVILQSSKHLDKADEYRFLHPWLGTGLLTSTGSKWKSRRRMLTPTFHFKILNDFVGVFHDQATIMVKKLSEVADGREFNIFNYITLCALDIICETAMGRTVDAQSNSESDYVKSVYKMTELVLQRQRTPWYWPDFLYNTIGYGKEHDRCLQILHGFTKKVIKEKMESQTEESRHSMEEMLSQHSEEDMYRSKGQRLAFLDMLLCKTEDGSQLSMEDIREEVDTFMFEGHDTTAAAMNWAVHLIGADPQVQAKVHEEMDQVFGDSDRPATMNDLKEMRYLECCIKEALRLFPSVPFFGRKLTEDCQFDEYKIPKGTTVIITPPGLHRDTRYFPDPEKFDPDRFSPENSLKRHPYSYVPFSAGPRNCIGQKFALLEEKVMLSNIFRKFSVTSKQTREELLPIGDLIMRPEHGIFVEIRPRQK